MSKNPYALIFDALAACEYESKCAAIGTLKKVLDDDSRIVVPASSVPPSPGSPVKLHTVDPRSLPRRGLSTPEGHGAFLHAICHIEFSAINLALDAILRFPNLPDAYYSDWAQVAIEEAAHFQMLQVHLLGFGFDYGDFPVHGGLWDMAQRSAGDVLMRMALVPRVMEARGLDVTPAMIVRLRNIDDQVGANILEKILTDEIRHVATGTRWFNYIAKLRGLDPESTFFDLLKAELGAPRSRQLNKKARRMAGFSEAEIRRIESLAK